MDPYEILPHHLWILIAVNIDDIDDLRDLAECIPCVGRMLKRPVDSVYDVSGIAKPPDVYVKYCKMFKKTLNYNKILCYNSFEMNESLNLTDIMKFDWNVPHYKWIALDLHTETVNVLVQRHKYNPKDLNIGVDLTYLQIPKWLPIVYTIRFSGFVEESASEEACNFKSFFGNCQHVMTKAFTWKAQHDSVAIDSNRVMNLKAFEMEVVFHRRYLLNCGIKLPENDSYYAPSRTFRSLKEMHVTWSIDSEELQQEMEKKKKHCFDDSE